MPPKTPALLSTITFPTPARPTEVQVLTPWCIETAQILLRRGSSVLGHSSDFVAQGSALGPARTRCLRCLFEVCLGYRPDCRMLLHSYSGYSNLYFPCLILAHSIPRLGRNISLLQ